jgi:hypothetical protein
MVHRPRLARDVDSRCIAKRHPGYHGEVVIATRGTCSTIFPSGVCSG